MTCQYYKDEKSEWRRIYERARVPRRHRSSDEVVQRICSSKEVANQKRQPETQKTRNSKRACAGRILADPGEGYSSECECLADIDRVKGSKDADVVQRK